MKKTLLSVIAGLAVINTASAEMTVEQSRNLCNRHPEKYVWVEKDQFCAPINPCKSDNSAIQEAYCNRVFKDINLGNWAEGMKVAKAYSKQYLGTEVTEIIGNNRDINTFGQDYMPCKLSNGGYVVFEFDDLSDFIGNDEYEGAVKSACIIYNGEYRSRLYNSEGGKNGFYCIGLSESGCNDVAHLASDILDDALVNTEYTENDNPAIHSYTRACTFFVE